MTSESSWMTSWSSLNFKGGLFSENFWFEPSFQEVLGYLAIWPRPWLFKIATTKTALESLFLKLETYPGCLWIAETQTVQMRPSRSKSEVVTNWRIFQKPPRNQEKSWLPCTKMALVAKPCLCMTWETTQKKRLGFGFDLPPWVSKSVSVANWRIFQKLTTSPKWS